MGGMVFGWMCHTGASSCLGNRFNNRGILLLHPLPLLFSLYPPFHCFLFPCHKCSKHDLSWLVYLFEV